MARVDVKEVDVFRSIVTRLRSELSLDERQCFLVLNDRFGVPRIPLGVPEDGFYVTVAPGESSFDDGLVVGHPVAQVTEDATVQVTGITRVHLDDSDHDEQLLTMAGRGLMDIKRRIIIALSGVDLTIDNELNSNTFLRALIRPVAVSRPEVGFVGDGESMPVGYITVTFAVSYDWDLAE